MTDSVEQLQILYEDNHLIVINKSVGDLVQGDKTGDTPLSELVKAYIKIQKNKPGKVFLGVVHRLDRPTSGAVIFARTSKALTRLSEMFRNKTIEKTYWAIVKQPPNPHNGTLKSYLKKNPKNNRSTSYRKPVPGSKEAVLHYKTLKTLDRYSLLGITLETGRHHQIRCQLASLGSPIKGDLKYGFDRSNPDGGIHLHARQLQFVHPVTKEHITIVADMPDDPIWNACG